MAVNLRVASKPTAASIIGDVFGSPKSPRVFPKTIQNTICDYLQPASRKRKRESRKISIAKDYDIAFQSKKVRNPEKAKMFLLGEIHTLNSCRKINKTFIKKMAPKGGVLILEGFPFDKGVIKGEDFLEVINEAYLLDKPFLHKCRILGWDFKGIYTLVRILQEERAKAGADATSPKLGKNRLSYNQFSREMILMTFPERTQSMIDTLHSVNKWIEKTHFSGKVFLIAGDSHLKTLEEMHGDPRSSLTTLYKALEKYEAVVLIPKIISEADSH